MFLRKWKDNYYLTYKWRSVHDNLLGKLVAYPDTRQGICSSWILINSNIWCRVRSMKSSPNKMQNTIANWTQTLGPTHIYLVSDNITFFFSEGSTISNQPFSRLHKTGSWETVLLNLRISTFYPSLSTLPHITLLLLPNPHPAITMKWVWFLN